MVKVKVDVVPASMVEGENALLIVGSMVEQPWKMTSSRNPSPTPALSASAPERYNLKTVFPERFTSGVTLVKSNVKEPFVQVTAPVVGVTVPVANATLSLTDSPSG